MPRASSESAVSVSNWPPLLPPKPCIRMTTGCRSSLPAGRCTSVESRPLLPRTDRSSLVVSPPCWSAPAACGESINMGRLQVHAQPARLSHLTFSVDSRKKVAFKSFCLFVLQFAKLFVLLHALKEGWQSDRMRWTRNPVYPLCGIGGLNPSPSAFMSKRKSDESFLFSFIVSKLRNWRRVNDWKLG